MMTRVLPVSTLERPLYGFPQVDDLLGLAAGTARRWIDGYTRDKREYAPVVRAEHTGDEAVTWGEFIEVGLLAQYRDLNVPLQRLRPVVQLLREELGVPYPLAHARPWVNQRDLVVRAQELVGIDAELRFVVPRTGQIVLADRADAFFQRVRWAEDEAVSFAIEADSSVLVDPLRSFGSPSVGGIRTDVLAELVEAGETVGRVARVYNLARELVDQAVDYERRRAA